MALMWLSFSLHYPFGAVVADACIAFDEVLEDGNFHGMRVLVSCDNSTEFAALQNLATDAIDKVTETGCDLLSEYCNTTVLARTPPCLAYAYVAHSCPVCS